jgi:mRNA-degrading endonuclease RelE of RelBE toxin-antitoxin system
MVDKIQKALDKLSAKERAAVKDILEKIEKKNFDGLDLKKLKGRDDVYRVRKGDIRIIYRMGENKEIFVLEIGRRNDNTYNF